MVQYDKFTLPLVYLQPYGSKVLNEFLHSLENCLWFIAHRSIIQIPNVKLSVHPAYNLVNS
jgi:hypothetical protein